MIVESVRAGVKRVLAVKFKERLRLQIARSVGSPYEKEISEEKFMKVLTKVMSSVKIATMVFYYQYDKNIFK